MKKRSLKVLLIMGMILGLGATLMLMAAADEPTALNIIRAPRPVVIDGKLDEWVLTAPVTYEVDSSATDRSVRTYAMWDDQNLYLAFRVYDSSPMKNSGNDPSSAFKTGDALHLYFSTDKDLAKTQADGGLNDFHILMTVQQEKPVIFAFRQQKAGASKPVQIASPATKIELAWMGPVSGAEMNVQPFSDLRGKGYIAEIKLPLEFFDGFKPEPGRKVAADVAVDFSDTAGTKNLAKVWWNRGSSQILDIPTELRFERNLWGQAIFRSAGELPLITDNANFFVVPAPGKVNIDGDLSDWDLSCPYGPHYVDTQLKDKFNVTWVAMYDAQALYLGAIFNSAGKFENDGGVNNVWWLGDSLEFRMSADPKKQAGDPRTNKDILTFGVWYNPQEKKDFVALQRSFNFEIGDTSAITLKSRATEGGRTFEMRVPWSLIQSGNAPKGGDSIAWTMASIWKNGLRAYGMGSISSFRGMNDWGEAHFLAAGKQKLSFLNLRKPVETGAAADDPLYRVSLDVPAKGLLSAGIYTPDGRLIRTLLAGRETVPGKVDLPWNGKTDTNEPASPGKYEVRAVVNAGLAAHYVTSATSPGKPPYASENPKGGWGGVWGNVIDIASDARGIYPLWAIEEGDGALMQIDDDGNLQWRQHIPLALSGTQVALTSNGKYVFVGVDVAGKNAGKAGLWRVRCEDGAYVPYQHEGSDPLEFYLDGVTRPVAEKGKKETALPAIGSLAADAKTLYVSARHLDKVLCFDAETGKPGKIFDVEKPLGLCLDGKGGLLAVSGTRIVRIDTANGRLAPVITDGLVAPHDVACDSDGSILVTDRGTSQQVKRFDNTGRLLKSFGKAGGRDNNGRYVLDQLSNPAGVTVSASGKVFFSEDAAPRVFVRLSPDLKYEKLWAGPWYISGEVCVDPYKPEDIYTWGGDAFIRHKIDYKNRTSAPDAVWNKFATPGTAGDEWWSVYGRWFPRIVRHKDVTYMFCGGPVVSLFRIDGYENILVASIGVDRDKSGWKDKWIFTDLNMNGKVDDGERIVTVQDAKSEGAYTPSYWGGSIDERDMTVYLLDGRGSVVFALTPTFQKNGVPLYSFGNMRTIPLAAAQKTGQRANLSSVWHTPDGGVFGNADANGSDPRGIGHSSHLSDVYVYRLDKDGRLLWRAGKKASGIAKNGEFYGRACGLGGPIAGKYFSFVDENGQDKVFTDDGLFVGNLLNDGATATPSEYTLFVEHFNSFVYQNAEDGKWYFAAGAGGYASIWEITGLDKIHRLKADIDVK